MRTRLVSTLKASARRIATPGATASTPPAKQAPHRRRWRAAGLGLCLALAAWPVLATFHLMKIVEVYTGSVSAPNAHYVVLQMYASGQNLVGGHPVTVFDAAGNVIAEFTFNRDVPNGSNQARILIATPEAQSFFGINADLTMTAAMMRAGAKVCFDTVDCVAWGAYTGATAGVGTPFNAAGGIPPGRAMARRLDITGSPTTLEGGDDTNNCAVDFVSAIPIPRNNAGASGLPPASTCGNGAIEGLEQCDDGNTTSGDGCSSTCVIDTPAARLSVGNVSVSEGNSGTRTVNFVAQLSQASPAPVRYNIATANGTATAGSDYVARSLVDETIPAGQTSRAFAVTINGDLVREPDETFLANVSNVRGAGVADAQGQGTIVNDDNPVLTVADIAVAEGNSGHPVATFVVRMSQPSSTPVTYSIATSNLTATAGSDYVASSLTGETILPGQTARTFTVTLNGDTTAEANETFRATISSATVSIADGTADATILNDDGPTLSVADVTLAEGNSGTRLANFTVRLSQPSASPVTYALSTANMTALSGSDYVARTLNDTMPAGATSRVFAVTLNGDATVEPNETFAVRLTNAVGATIFDGAALGTILNDDGPTLSVADVVLTEGNSGTRLANFTIRMSQPATVPIAFQAVTSNGSAIGGSDYVIRSVSDAIPVGATARTFAVAINGDTAVEPNETFGVTLRSATGATISDGAATGVILNDDGQTLSIGDLAFAETNAGTRTFGFTVFLPRPATVPVTYTVATANGTAVAGGDYVARSLVDTIPVGQSSRSFVVTTNGDTTVEPNETFLARLSNATGASILDASATGTILNDDGPTLSIGNIAFVEGNAGSTVVTFTVRLSQASPNPVTYNIATSNATATAGSDYIARQLTGEVIAPGQTSRNFQVAVVGDTVKENHEVFVVTVSSAVGATIFDGIATAEIVNDDP